MNRFFVIFIAAALLLPLKAWATEERESVLEVRETAVKEVPPDAALIVLSVETTGKTAREASELNAESSAEVIRGLKRLVGEGGEVATSSYNIVPVYDRKNTDAVKGYRVENRVSVRTERVDEVGDIVDRAVEYGANRVLSIGFVISGYEAHCPGLLKEAAGAAVEKANEVAAAFGTRVSGVKRIMPHCRPETPRGVYAEHYAAKAATPIEPGGLRVTGTVDVQFYLEPAPGSR